MMPVKLPVARILPRLYSIAIILNFTSAATAQNSSSTGDSGIVAKTDEDEIVVVADVTDTQVDRKVYRVLDSPFTETANSAQILRYVPLLRVSDDGAVSLLGVSGVKILIDGKEVPEPFQFLRALPAARVARIEVISNPSGEFSTYRAAGIINIVLRRNFSSGVSGQVAGSIDRLGTIEARVAPVWSYDNWTLTGLVSASRPVVRSQQERVLLVNGSSPQLIESFRSRTVLENLTGSASLLHRFSGGSELQWSANGILGGSHIDQSNSFVSASTPGVYISGFSVGEITAKSFITGVSYQDKSGPLGSDLSLNSDYRRVSTSADFETKSNGLSVSDNSSKFVYESVEAGVVAKFTKERRLLSMGASLEKVSTTSDSSYNFKENGTSYFSGNTAFSGYIIKADSFATYQLPILSFDVKAGLRIERRDYSISKIATTDNTPRFTRLIPSIHIELPLTSNLVARTSYSRRYSYPEISALDPALQLSGPFTGKRGNPELRPEATDTFDVGGEWKIGSHSLQFRLMHQDTENVWLTEQAVESGNLVISRQRNFGSRKYSGGALELSGPLIAQLKYELSASCATREYKLAGTNNFRDKSCLATAGLRYKEPNFNKQNGDMLDLDINWNSNSNDPFVSTKSYWTADATWSHRFSDRLNALFEIRDILDTGQQRIVYSTPSGLVEQRSQNPSPKVKLTLSYSLGPKTSKAPVTQ